MCFSVRSGSSDYTLGSQLVIWPSSSDNSWNIILRTSLQKSVVSSPLKVSEFLRNAVDAYTADITIMDGEYVEKSIDYMAILVM